MRERTRSIAEECSLYERFCGLFTEVRGIGILRSSYSAERVGLLALGHLLLQLRSHHHALLLIGIGPRHDEYHRCLASIDRHMRHPRRDVQVVAGVGHVPMLELLTRPQLYLLAADDVDRGLVVLVQMGLGPPASWRERPRAEPDCLGARALCADSRGVVWSLLALVALPRSHHAPKICPCRAGHSHSSDPRPPVLSVVTGAYT